ncbi:MAG: transaldolase [Acidobacteriota bacterium]
MSANPLHQLKEHGQSVWLDNLARPLITSGELQRLIRDDGITGVTSNPAIFKNAMTGSDAYDAQIETLVNAGCSTEEIYEALAIQDVQDAAELLYPVYQKSQGEDGFVSLEVSPHLARDTQGTVDDALRLWKAVDRPNIFIKIPGTDEGIPAVQTCLAQGVNINITLLFSLSVYKQVIEAFIRAMHSRQQRGKPLDTVASVASFFLSRIDVKVDRALDTMIESGDHPREAAALKGKTAIASAQLAYQIWNETVASPRWQSLEENGARVQKLLWASTSTKNPDYSDVMYVEPLIGRQTINTMPGQTIDAFRDHGRVGATLEEGADGARRIQKRLEGVGINLDQVTRELVDEGIQKFVQPFTELMDALEKKRAALTARRSSL